MIQGLDLSLKEILGNAYYAYLEKVVLPQVKALAANGKISPHQIKKLDELTEARGIDVLAPQLRLVDIVTKTTIEDGYIAEAALRVTEGVEIRHIVKKFPFILGNKDFDRALQIQKNLEKVVKGTEFEDSIPKPEFVNKPGRIIVTPYAEGETLNEVLASQNPAQKEQTLRKVLDDYVSLFSYLNSPAVKVDLKLPVALDDVNETFNKYYLGKEPDVRLKELFERDIGDNLNQARTQIVHGDFHTRNIILNGKTVYLDWGNAGTKGYPEFDIRKLLLKADIDEELEARLIDYAACKLHETHEDRERFKERYEKNYILGGLIASKRYLVRSTRVDNEEVRNKLKAMATYFYNDAINRAERAAESEIISRDLWYELIKNPPQVEDYKLELVDDLNKLKEQFNPNAFGSHEHIEPTTPLTEIVLDEDKGAISRIERRVRSERRNIMLVKAGVLGLGLVGLLSAFVAGSVVIHGENKRKEEQAQLERSKEFQLAYYKDDFKRAYNEAKTEAAEGKLKTRLKISSKIIDEVAEQYADHGVTPRLLRDIIRVNRVEASLDWSGREENIRIDDINLLYPFPVESRKNQFIVDPIENLKYGARELARELDNNKGDVKKALIGYYRGGVREYGPTRDISAPESELVREELKVLSYNVMHGIGWGFDAGIMSLFMRTPPKDF